MKIDKDSFPEYSYDDLTSRMTYVSPVVKDELGYWTKRDDLFDLGGLSGGKVRQALWIVHHNLFRIKDDFNSGLITGASLPSPQTAIVAGVARYFGLKCAVVTYRYKDGIRDINRINVSLAQHLGATVYGCPWTRKSAVEAMTRRLADQLGYYHVDFGMAGRLAMAATSCQVVNVPDQVHEIVVVGGSGMNAAGIAMGLGWYKNNVKKLTVVDLSGYTSKTLERWYYPFDDCLKFSGVINIVKSTIGYNMLHQGPYDMTYENKAYRWMVDYHYPIDDLLFWVIGKREYNWDYIEPIRWEEEHDPQSTFTF